MLARLLAWIATAAGLVLIVVLATGGFRIDIGPVRISSHNVVPLLVVMAATALALAWHGAARSRAAFASIVSDLTLRAPAVAAIAAAAIAGVGVGFGTFSASAADPSAYVSHGALIDSGRLSIAEPLARDVDWHEATWTFTPLGYRPGPSAGTIVPGYPLGLPLVMAASRRAAGDDGPFLVGPGFAALAVLATYALAARFAGPLAGAFAAVLAASSPIVQFQTVQPMSDVPAMAWWALAVACASRRTLASAAGAGMLTGMAVLTWPNLTPFGMLVATVAAGWPHPAAAGIDFRRAMACAAGVAPFILLLAGLQYRLYGSPLRTGYGDVSDFFAAANIWPNAGDYTRRLLTGEGPALTLAGIAAIALAGRRTALPRGLTALAGMAAAAAAIVLALYLPYGVFPDWSSFRFLMPALPLAFAAVGALAAEALGRVAPPARGPVLVASLTLAVSLNVTHAAQQNAYALRDYEARYRTVGEYLAAAQPRNTVIVTSQQSGSARYYTGLPILRWDLLDGDLDAAIARLRTLGRRPVLVVEDWEKPVLRQRFPSGPIASLDWTPRAEAGRTTRVGVWDPDDRGKPANAIVTDRLP